MSDARSVIHELVNSLTIAEGMAKILKNNVTSAEPQTFEDNLARLEKVVAYLAKAQADLAALRQMSKEKSW